MSLLKRKTKLRSKRERSSASKPKMKHVGIEQKLTRKKHIEEEDPDLLQEEQKGEDEEMLRDNDVAHDTFFHVEETADEKRLRMTKSLLSSLAAKQEENEQEEEEEKEKDEDEVYGENEQDVINKKLKLAYLEKQNKIFKEFVPRLSSSPEQHFFKGHKKAITCLAAGKDAKTLYTGAKDCCIIKWDTATKTKTIYKGEKHNREIHGHYDEILDVALSEDEKLLLSVGKDRIVRLWDTHNAKLIHSFKGHNDTITGVKMDPVTGNFYTISYDRTLKMWNLPERAYIDTYYGHKREGLCIDAFYKDRVLTGGNDGQAIIWKLSDETQLLYKSSCQVLDCVHKISEKFFLTTGEQAVIELWSVAKKAPLFSLEKAHDSLWISSIAGMRNTDLLATGAADGYVNLYRFSEEKKSVEKIRKIPLEGCINSMLFVHNGNTLICAQGDEQRLGRWDVIRNAKPGVTLFTGLLTDS